MQYISRVVGGWNVRMMLNGTRHGKFFADAKSGGKAKALAAAKAYRNELVLKKPNPLDRKPRPLLVTRGSTQCFQIRIPKSGGGMSTTEFSVARHGKSKAKRMAIDAFNTARAAARR